MVSNGELRRPDVVHQEIERILVILTVKEIGRNV
jgi:hypothetical protein